MVDYLERALGQTEPDGEAPETGIEAGPMGLLPRRDRSAAARRAEPDSASGGAPEPDGAAELAESGDGGADTAEQAEPGEDAAEPGGALRTAIEEARRGAVFSAAAQAGTPGAGRAGSADGDGGQRQSPGPAEAADRPGGRTAGVRSAAAYGGAGWADETDNGGAGPGRRTADRPVDALRMAGTAAGDLYASLARSRAAAGYVRRETVAVTVPEPPGQGTGGAAPDARALDRQFQRDARRYDGGFPLF